MCKRILIVAVVLAVFVCISPVAQAANATTYDLSGAAGYDVMWEIGGGTWGHHLTIATMDLATGTFTGTGYFLANKDYSWNIVNGKVIGNAISFQVLYNNANPGYHADQTGLVTSTTDFGGNCTTSQAQVPCTWYHKGRAKTTDTDGDGVPDDKDSCGATAAGAKINPLGCSMEQLCPCTYFENHGKYVSCIAKAKNEFVAAGILTNAEASAIQSAAGQSNCGK